MFGGVTLIHVATDNTWTFCYSNSPDLSAVDWAVDITVADCISGLPEGVDTEMCGG